jgi:chromosome segregation ATPase
MLPWIVAAVSLIVLLVAMVASARGQRQLRVAHEESIATKNEQIASLEAQLASLRGSESIRFVDRYVAAKKGLEERTASLHEQLESSREQTDKLRDELNDLGLSDRERESEMDRLLRDLSRTSDQIRRLELVLREVASVGPMDVETIRVELDSRRELSAHIRERVDRLSAQEHDRNAARESRTHQLERLNEEAARLRRDIEITRTAASVVDGILGIDADIRKRLARHVTDHIDEALQSLGDVARRDPISHLVDVLEQQRPDRLLERGRAAAPAEAHEADAPVVPPEPQVEARSGPAPERATDPIWVPAP